MADRAIKARDGTRLVYVWVVIDDGVQGGAVIPEDLVSRALKDRARLDVIKFSTNGDKADIEHMMNAPIK